jgi:hypothetical protein
MRKTLVVIGLLALSSAAMAQTPAPAAGGGQSQSGATLPTCSAADATRIRNGETPSTPCRVSSDQQASSGTGSPTPTPSGGTPAPSR